MPMSRLRRAGALLLVLWLTADVAALGMCVGDSLTASAAVSAGDDSHEGPSCCTCHHCFCCSAGAEIITFTLPVEEQGAILTPQGALNAPAISVPHTSPPPRR